MFNREDKKLISVIICSYNRCQSLKGTLESFLIQDYDSNFDFEIIVVDNNSTDETKQTVEDYMLKFDGRLRYIFEENSGLSYARNRGINEAKGEAVAFTDDDCVVDRRWIVNLGRTFKDFDADCVGGKILPFWQDKKPNWLSEKLFGRLALLDYGDKQFRIKDSSKYPIFGANFAFRKEVFSKYGFFDIKLGMTREKLFCGEDTYCVDALLKRNAKIIYHPSIIVHHKISKERLRKRYFLKWHFDTGISEAQVKRSPQAKRIVFDIPRYMVRQLLRNIFYLFVSIVRGKKKEIFFYECSTLFLISFFLTKARKNLPWAKRNF